MKLLAQDSEGMQTLLNAIQEFEEWSGIPVNTMKTKQMTVDGIEANRAMIAFGQPPMAICRWPRTWCMTGHTEPRNLYKGTRWILNK
jgi:hypothetical protein